VLIEAVDEQRGATLALFTEELAELIEAVHAERIIVIEAFTAERVATIEAIVPLMQDAIDHAVWRAAQLLAAMGLFVVLLAGAVVFALRRGRGQPPVLNPTENVR
jgi:hypothetical protein